MSDPRTALAVHFWGKPINVDADWIAFEALKALTQAGYVVAAVSDTDRDK